MHRLAKILFITIIMVVSCAGILFADSGSIVIKLDGVDIINDSPPVIVDDRTLVPARAVFEAMGGSVSWNEESKEVMVNVKDKTIKLKIDSKKAYINDVEKIIDVPAKIINSRTMIPIRFVSEAAGCTVSWDDKNRVVSIVSTDAEEDADWIKVNDIELSDNGNKVVVKADDKILEYKSFIMTDPSRLVLDIKDAILDMNDGTITVSKDNQFFKSIRYSQYTKDTVRIVADLKNSSSGVVSRSDSMRTAYLTFEVEETEDPDGEDGDQNEDDYDPITKEEQAILDQYGLSPVEHAAQQKLVVIDPGHGGEDPGSRGFENGVAVLNEKDVNLDIALRIEKMLDAAGTKIHMIRTTDKTIPLYDRQDKANSLEASLYVAIHNNSYTSSIPSGTEVLYFGNDEQPKDGISSVTLAKDLQSTLVSNLGLVNRGAKTSPGLAVLRRTEMPAVIIEGAFISNPDNLSYMKTDDFREKYAISVAECIIDALNNSI